MQRVQNSLVLLVVGARRSAPASSLLADLHWLPIPARIEYKFDVITFTTLQSRHVFIKQIGRLDRAVILHCNRLLVFRTSRLQ